MVAVPSLPARLQVEVTAACNLRCRMCIVRYRDPIKRNEGTLSLECFARILDEVPGVQEITLQGVGEPLLIPHLPDMVEMAARRGIATGFNTNATLLTPAKSERLITAGLRWLCISVDGATAGAYEDVRDGAKFTRVVRNIQALVQARDRLGADDLQLRVVFMAMRRNVAELPALVGLVAAWGIPALRVQNLSHVFSDADPGAGYAEIRDYAESEALWRGGDVERVATIFEAARVEAERLGVDLRLPRLEAAPLTSRPQGSPGCSWPWESAYIGHDGSIQPCYMLMGSERGRLGHLREAEFGRIWAGPAYQDFRAALMGPEPPDVCRGCSEYRGVF